MTDAISFIYQIAYIPSVSHWIDKGNGAYSPVTLHHSAHATIERAVAEWRYWTKKPFHMPVIVNETTEIATDWQASYIVIRMRLA